MFATLYSLKPQNDVNFLLKATLLQLLLLLISVTTYFLWNIVFLMNSSFLNCTVNMHVCIVPQY